MKEHDIDILLERFLNAQTTEAEERELKQYFLTYTDIPARWEPYKALFQSFETNLYAAPADNEPIPNERKPQETARRNKRISFRPLFITSGIAAAAVAAFFIISSPRSTHNPAPPEQTLASNNQTNQPNPTNPTNRTNPVNNIIATNSVIRTNPANNIIPADPEEAAMLLPTATERTDTVPPTASPAPAVAPPAPVAPQENTVIVSIDKLPITNPDALQLTREDITRIARDQARSYIEKLRNDLEEDIYQLNHPSQIEQVVII